MQFTQGFWSRCLDWIGDSNQACSFTVNCNPGYRLALLPEMVSFRSQCFYRNSLFLQEAIRTDKQRAVFGRSGDPSSGMRLKVLGIGQGKTTFVSGSHNRRSQGAFAAALKGCSL